jgi:hypothetical protein
MCASTRRLTPAAAIAASTWPAFGAPADPTGHWEGAIQAPSGDVSISVDVAAGADGTFVGAFSNPGEELTGYPFANVVVDGESVRLEIKTADPGVQAFAGTIGADGQSFAGNFLVSVYSVPFSFVRRGASQLAETPASPAIDAALAGTWNATLAFGGKDLSIALTLENGADGNAIGRWSAGSATPTPIAIAADGRSVTLTSTVSPTRFAGTLSADGLELAGTFSERGAERALTFSRSSVAQ